MNNVNFAPGTPEPIINVSEDKDLKFWSRRFGVRPEVIKTAIRATHSTYIVDVQDYLKKRYKVD